MCSQIEASELVRHEFGRLKGVCYLDHVGSALYADSQIDNVMNDLKTHLYGNPHSTGKHSAACEDQINNIRFKILKHFNTGPEKYSVIFTSGATGALKTVAEYFDWGDGDDCQPGSPSSTFAYTEDNHTSVLGMRELAPAGSNALCLTRHEAREALSGGTRSATAATGRRRPAAAAAGHGNSLFAYPAQSNFSGTKYPLEWIETCRRGALDRYAVAGGPAKTKWYVVLDASAYVPTNHLDLDRYTPDFVAISFYKMFGYPTGLGALLVHNGTGVPVLARKRYFGGGTVEVVLAHDRHHVFKRNVHEKFEDGTVDFLSVIAVGHGLDALRALAGPMRAVSGRTFQLAAHLYRRMTGARHGNGRPVFRVYADTAYECEDEQGGVVNFNVLRAGGQHVGYNEVKHVADSRGIVLRVGCFCNPGACQAHLGHTDQELRRNQEEIGHICGDHIDLIDGRPTGSVRVSFGYQSTALDADTLYDTLVAHFRQNAPVMPIAEPRITLDELNKMDLHVSKIFVYPIKSCGVFVTDEWPMESYGFRYDRNWAVVSERGVCMTQMEEPRLCLVRPHVDLQKGIMTLVYAENEDEVPMTVPLETSGQTERLGKICWGGSIKGIDCGDVVADWLSWNLDRPGLRLVRCTERNPPDVNNYGNLDPKVLGANQCQYLLTTESTIKWLKQEMDNDITEMDQEALQARFRGNIVVAGDGLPAYAEYSWQKMDIGCVSFETDSVCERCKMVNIDQDTADAHYKPLSVLAQNKLRGKSVFGIYLRRIGDIKSTLQVGQRIVVVQQTDN